MVGVRDENAAFHRKLSILVRNTTVSKYFTLFLPEMTYACLNLSVSTNKYFNIFSNEFSISIFFDFKNDFRNGMSQKYDAFNALKRGVA